MVKKISPMRSLNLSRRNLKIKARSSYPEVLDPLHERIKSFEKRVEDTYSNEAKERYSLQKEVKNPPRIECPNRSGCR